MAVHWTAMLATWSAVVWSHCRIYCRNCSDGNFIKTAQVWWIRFLWYTFSQRNFSFYSHPKRRPKREFRAFFDWLHGGRLGVQKLLAELQSSYPPVYMFIIFSYSKNYWKYSRLYSLRYIVSDATVSPLVIHQYRCTPCNEHLARRIVEHVPGNLQVARRNWSSFE